MGLQVVPSRLASQLRSYPTTALGLAATATAAGGGGRRDQVPASRAGKIFTFLKKFFRRPFGEVKIKFFLKKNFRKVSKRMFFRTPKTQ